MKPAPPVTSIRDTVLFSLNYLFYDSRRDSDNRRVCGHVLGDDRTRSDHTMRADRDVIQNNGGHADIGVMSNVTMPGYVGCRLDRDKILDGRVMTHDSASFQSNMPAKSAVRRDDAADIDEAAVAHNRLARYMC